MYNEAGVHIYALKLSRTPTCPTRNTSRSSTRRKLSAPTKSPWSFHNAAFTQRIGDFAARKKMVVAYHVHLQATITAWDAVLAQSKGNAINLDRGHYVAGTSESPIPLIQKKHARIASMHMKDRKIKANGGDNLPWARATRPSRRSSC